ncbi:hypothetical protein [Paenibacillus sp. Marseille-Q4541]|uniref:BC1872 family protein n=1 Tax=Paenibacillus sp. Marseille-Q4541 TaxID=2831522 RepID=UPI001BACE4A8|nr:hypothetical protein [Paenibacillus sp. Marseille-Q4541]
MSKRVITDEEILNLPPGRDLDAHVALRVMGFKEITIVGKHYFTDPIDTKLKLYSTDISAAWEIVDKLKIQIIPQSIGAPDQLSYLAIYNNEPFESKVEVFGRTAPEAICKAALITVIGGSGNE